MRSTVDIFRRLISERKSALLIGNADAFLSRLLYDGDERTHTVTISRDGPSWSKGSAGLRLSPEVDASAALKAILRQDPDCIVAALQNELPTDIIRASILTGHQVVLWWEGASSQTGREAWGQLGFDWLIQCDGDQVDILEKKTEEPKTSPVTVVKPEVPKELIDKLENTLSQHRRKAYRPMSSDGIGKSFLAEVRPEVEGLQIVLQLASPELPGFQERFPENLPYLQLSLDDSGTNFHLCFSAASLPSKYPVAISGWEEFSCLPHFEDDRVSLDEESLMLWGELDSEGHRTLTLDDGDYLGGWPFWAQAQQHRACPKCGEPMQLLFQLSSERGALIPGLFAAEGTGQILQCLEHLEELTWAWAC